MKKTLLAACLCTATLASYAQKYIGLSTSNWGGISTIYLNPANVADNKDRLAIDIINLNAGVDNNLGTLNSIGKITKFIKDSSADVNQVFKFSSKKEFSLLTPYFEMRGPGFMMNINHRFAFGVTTRLRGINQFNHFDQTLYRTILDTGYVSNGNIDLVSNNFNWTAHLWAETGITFGGIIMEKGHHLLKAGVTLRYLAGVGYLGLKGNLDAHYVKGADSFYANKLNVEYASNILNAQGAIGVTSANFFEKFFGKKQGNGVGGDIGVVYDYIEDTLADKYDMDGKTSVSDQSKNRYKYRVSASITDMGRINYNATNNYGLSVSGTGSLTGDQLRANVKNFDDFRTYAKSKGFKADTGFVSSKLYMPAALNLSADYHAWKWLYVNATFFANLANRNNFGNSFYNFLSVTPRLDKPNYTVAVPVTYSALTNNIKMGIAGRYKGFFLGSDDMLMLFSKRQYGLNVYLGASVTFHKVKPHDRDGDHVSDKRDRCPDDAGSWKHHGCPTKEDTADNCPDAEGLGAMLMQEAKDTDGDGIPDSEDACPTVAGTADHHGCPDAHQYEQTVVNLREATLNVQKGKNIFSKDDYARLNRFAKLLKEYPAQHVEIAGWNLFSFEHKKNMKQAERYASSAKKYLVRKGIPASRIVVSANARAAASDKEPDHIVVTLVK